MNITRFLVFLLIVILIGCGTMTETPIVETPITEPPVEAVEYLSIDTITLRHDADFELELAEGIHWVPANVLGGTQLTNEEILENVGDYIWVRENVNTLYELIQYIQVSNFTFAFESPNITIDEGNLAWQHFQPAEIVIMNNTGNCAGNANLFVYALSGKYDEVGKIVWQFDIGGGHFLNYIYHDGYYYALDISKITSSWLSSSVEDGTMTGYIDSDLVAGNIHRSTSLEEYVDYYFNTLTEYGFNPPIIFGAFSDIFSPPIEMNRRFNSDYSRCVLFPDVLREHFTVLREDPYGRNCFDFIDAPLLWPKVWEPYYDRWWLDE